MIDYKEVQYGHSLLTNWFNAGTNRDDFIRTFDDIHSGAARAAIYAFDNAWQRLDIGAQTQTYIGSVSEHDPSEDEHGRLSMWRAFGADASARVALVFKVPPFSGALASLHCLFSPVSYVTEARANEIVTEILSNAIAERDFLKTLAPQEVINWLVMTFTVAVSCVKTRRL